MDAIDELRLKVAVLESQMAMLSLDHSPSLLPTLDQRITKIEGMLPTIERKVLDAELQAVVAGSQAAVLQDALLRLTNQVAIVAATLGSAIHALKRGDAAASDQALADALASQDRLGSMLNEVAGRPR